MKKRHIAIQRLFFAIITILLLLPIPSWGYEKEIDTLSSAMADKIAKAGKKTVAVVDFTDLDGNVTQLGRFIAEELSGALAEKGQGFEVVNRSNLKLILKEHKLFEKGVIDQKAAMRLGEIAGVQALVTGTITPFTENVRLSVNVLDIIIQLRFFMARFVLLSVQRKKSTFFLRLVILDIYKQLFHTVVVC